LNIEEYIASGILEAYVLGDLSDGAKAEVEEMIQLHPEIKLEVQRIENTMEQVAITSGEDPGISFREDLLQQVVEKEPDPLVDFTPESVNQRTLTIAVAIMGLFLSGGILLYSLAHAQRTKKEMATTAIVIDSLAQQGDSLHNLLDNVRQDRQILLDPNYEKVQLDGLPIAPNALANVYWNRSTTAVYLDTGRLPDSDGDKQYQLWAIVSGQPVSVGVFDLPGESILRKMDDVQDAQAFTITLESFGGVVSPTLDQMYVSGNVSS